MAIFVTLLCFFEVLPVYGHAKAPAKNLPKNRAVKLLCAQLLTSPEAMPAVDVQGAPGLKILASELYGTEPDYEKILEFKTDAFDPHEVISSARYAKMINARAEETVLMVPGLEHRNIPGFDGVVLDKQGQPVANYSIKTLIMATADRTALKRAWDGVRQAIRFAKVERWLVSFWLLYEDRAGRFHVSDTLPEETARETRVWLAKAMNLFGVQESAKGRRPTRVVVDIHSELPMPSERDLEIMTDWVKKSKGLIESIVFLKGDQMLEVK